MTEPSTAGSPSARRLMIIVDEDAKVGKRPLFSEIVHRALEAGLAGASVFRGVEGYGSSRQIKTSRILDLSGNLPAMIVIVDSADAINAFLPLLESLGIRGVIAIDDVELVQPGTTPLAAR